MDDKNNNFQRPIDQDVAAARQAIRSRFSYVTKARANIWLTTGVTLFVLGLIGGGFVVLGGDPNAGSQGQAAELGQRLTLRGGHAVDLTDTAAHIDGPSAVEMGQATSYIFTAPNFETPVQYEVSWGDGSSVEQLDGQPGSGTGSAEHTYAQIGTFTITATAAGGGRTSNPGTLQVHVGNSHATAIAVSISLDPSTPPSRTIARGATDVAFAAIKISSDADVTIRSLIVVARGDVDASSNLGAVKVYSGSTLLGTGSFAAGGSANRAVISLGAGVTIAAGSSSQLTIKADVATDASAGTVALGIESAETNPVSTLSDNLPVYGNLMTIPPGKQIRIEGGPNKQP